MIRKPTTNHDIIPYFKYQTAESDAFLKHPKHNGSPFTLIKDMQTFVKQTGFFIFALLSFGVAGYAFMFLLQTANPNNPFQVKFAAAGWVVPMHFYAAGLALALSPLQLSRKLRTWSKSLHRTLGLVYVICVLAGGVSGLLMAIDATGGWVAKLGFASLAIYWLIATSLAFYHALKGNIHQHRRWMYRSVALTAAGITLRVFLGIGLGLLQLPFLTVYVPTAWLCWVLNALVCEIILARQRPNPRMAAQT